VVCECVKVYVPNSHERLILWNPVKAGLVTSPSDQSSRKPSGIAVINLGIEIGVLSYVATMHLRH